LLSTTSSLSLFPYTLPLTPKSTLFPYTTLFRSAIKAQYFKNGIANFITNGEHIATAVAEPIRVGDMGSKAQAHRIYSVDGKSTCLNANGGGLGAKTGLYAEPVEDTEKSPTLLAAAGSGGGNAVYYAERADGKTYPVYEVRNGYITIKDKQYPIKLKDGFYIIRKLTVTECCRLQ